jgi:hypothetical protein
LYLKYLKQASFKYGLTISEYFYIVLNKMEKCMCKFLLNLKGKLCANKTNSYVLPAKTINLFFNNSLDKQFKVINLESLSTIEFEILETIEEDKVKYQLCAILNNKPDNVLNIAKFSTKQDAEDAILKIRVSLTKTSSGLIKGISSIILLGVLVGIIFNIFYLTKIINDKQLTGIQTVLSNQSSNVNNPQYESTGPLPTEEDVEKSLPKIEQTGTPSISESELKKMFEQAQAQQNADIGNQATPQVAPTPVQQVPQEQQMSPADKLLQGLQ